MSSLITPADLLDLAYQQAHIADDRSNFVIAVTTALLTLATIAVALRILSRRLIKAPIKWDDALVILAVVSAAGPSAPYGQQLLSYAMFGVGVVMGVSHGLGKHILRNSNRDIEMFLLAEFIFEIIYCSAITTTKISILFLYRRLFATQYRFKRMLVLTGVAVILWCFTFTFVVVFQCQPIHRAWQRTIPGSCLDVKAIFISASALNMATDLVVLALPMSIVWALQISRKQKIALTAIFTLGGFVCVAGAVRVPYVIIAAQGIDVTWNTVDGGVWSFTEVCIGIVCACLPVVRPLFRGAMKFANSKSPKKSHGTTDNSITLTNWGNNRPAPHTPLDAIGQGSLMDSSEDPTPPATATESLPPGDPAFTEPFSIFNNINPPPYWDPQHSDETVGAAIVPSIRTNASNSEQLERPFDSPTSTASSGPSLIIQRPGPSVHRSGSGTRRAESLPPRLDSLSYRHEQWSRAPTTSSQISDSTRIEGRRSNGWRRMPDAHSSYSRSELEKPNSDVP
ncbi:MAG: hypothetical protein M1829_000015 [Trizodia sp. TS-e1964]|nr:MAG: hypothetical protein M1829_000015 [Trizodia sp. TS-e1964]